MSVSTGFLDLVTELLAPVGVIAVKRMFGGAGVYADGAFFAMIDDDVLYFKTDAASRARFAAAGTGPFTYQTKHGPGVLTSYWRVPERLYDESDEFAEWARTALDVARRAQVEKTRPSQQPDAPSKRPPRSP